MSDDTSTPVTTTDAGIPAPSDEFSLSAGAEGPLLLQDHYLIQKMAHFKRTGRQATEREFWSTGSGLEA